jgi:CheY-like chemotaxis protein
MANEGGRHRHAVLVVEDDHDTREAFILLAASAGLDVVAVENGREALRMLREGLRPCLIVLDMAMPEMDGFEFRRQQMADATLAKLPVAVMSGGGWATEADARKLGLTLFLRKPVEPAELLRAFTDHCGGKSS